MGNGECGSDRSLDDFNSFSAQSKRLTENQLLDPDMIKILFEED